MADQKAGTRPADDDLPDLIPYDDADALEGPTDVTIEQAANGDVVTLTRMLSMRADPYAQPPPPPPCHHVWRQSADCGPANMHCARCHVRRQVMGADGAIDLLQCAACGALMAPHQMRAFYGLADAYRAPALVAHALAVAATPMPCPSCGTAEKRTWRLADVAIVVPERPQEPGVTTATGPAPRGAAPTPAT